MSDDKWRERAEKAEAELAGRPHAESLATAVKRIEELEDAGIAENHAILTLTDVPREGYTLQEEIRAQLEEAQVELAAERERAEKLEKALRSLLSYTEACEGLLNASPAGQVIAAREALRLAAPDPQLQHVCGKQPGACEAYCKPEPTPSEELIWPEPKVTRVPAKMGRTYESPPFTVDPEDSEQPDLPLGHEFSHFGDGIDSCGITYCGQPEAAHRRRES